MRDLRILEELEEIRLRKVESAEKALALAKKLFLEAQEAQKNAEQALTDYSAKVPILVNELYATCIGQKVGKEFIEEQRVKEMKIHRHKEELATEHQKAIRHTQEAHLAVEEARKVLLAEQVRADNLGELVCQEQTKADKAEQLRENKRLDAFSDARSACNKV